MDMYSSQTPMQEFNKHIVIQIEEVDRNPTIHYSCVDRSRRVMEICTVQDNVFLKKLDLLIHLSGTTVQQGAEHSHTIEVLYPSSQKLREEIERLFADEYPHLKIMELGPRGLHQKYDEGVLETLVKNTIKSYLIQNHEVKCMNGICYIVDEDQIHQEKNYRHQFQILRMKPEGIMHIDSIALGALSVFPKSILSNSNTNTQETFNNLYDLLNNCKTKMGERCLRKWILQPLTSKTAIETRLDVVQLLVESEGLSGIFSDLLQRIPDLERQSVKFFKTDKSYETQKLSIREIVEIYNVFQQLRFFLEKLESHSTSHFDNSQSSILERSIMIPLKHIDEEVDEYRSLVEQAVDMDAIKDRIYRIKPEYEVIYSRFTSQQNGQSGMIEESGQSGESLQRLYLKLEKQNEIIRELLDEANNDFESDKSGRKSKMSVKIIQTETYRYLFELPKSIYQEKKDELKKYRFISEKSNKVKLLTDDLKKALVRTVELEREYERRSNQMLKHLSKNVSKFYEQLEALAMLISNIDCLNSFAIMIINQRHFSGFDLEEERQKVYCRPIVHENTDNINFRAPNRAESEVFSEEKHGHKGAIINLENSRHPVLLSQIRGPQCVPNSTFMFRGQNLSENSNFHVITGPNMGGKSTYIRQVALNILLCQIGCYVCAEYAEITILNSIVTRVGAGDKVGLGLSTFMTEMVEVSSMLANSFLIVDELGRGTSSNTGFGLTYAIAEEICQKLNSFCLYSTHFHEITELSDKHPNIRNYSLTAVESEGQLKMQYQLRDGCILDSFGFNVLKLVQIRENICEKASQNMKILTDMSHAGKVDENEIDVQTFKNQTKNHNFKELIIKKSQKLAQELQKYDPNRDRDIIQRLKDRFKEEVQDLHLELI